MPDASVVELFTWSILIVAPGNGLPESKSVTFPDTEIWAAARKGSSRAIDAANKFFKMCFNK